MNNFFYFFKIKMHNRCITLWLGFGQSRKKSTFSIFLRAKINIKYYGSTNIIDNIQKNNN